jgi:DNA polymerase-1
MRPRPSTTLNFQNIPIRSELGGRIRKGFTAPVATLIDADYSEIEQMILRHIEGQR